MNILLIEPYYGGSHRAWADGYRSASAHTVDLLTLPAQFWKWRMQGGGVTLARLYRERDLRPDVILASDMFNLATFRALTHDLTGDVPTVLYFHENQLTYPQNERQAHGWRYGFINYVSALAADRVFFNSPFHQHVFFENLPRMLKHFGDFNELETIDVLQARSEVLPLGLDLRRFDVHQPAETTDDAPPLILWNHRWEEDKNPKAFFAALYGLVKRDVPFRVALAGENFRQQPEEFDAARQKLGDRLVQYGHVASFADYARLVWEADYIASTAYQDFFGISVVEAIYCGCVPLLPFRLNYPDLIPLEKQADCLFRRNSLLPLLQRHLRGDVAIDVESLRAHVARFDWLEMAPIYDRVLAALLA